ncbi:hypothetical protein GCM10022630_19350 [Thermobifida alba]
MGLGGCAFRVLTQAFGPLLQGVDLLTQTVQVLGGGHGDHRCLLLESRVDACGPPEPARRQRSDAGATARGWKRI